MGNNVFIKNIPKQLTHDDLQKKFQFHGKIKSLKVSLNSDHTSRGYGFICFQEEASAMNAIERSKHDGEVRAIKFEPKDTRRSVRKLINNVYFKNVPFEMPEKSVRKMFAAHGHIKSLVLMKNNIGQFGFVCYDDQRK